MAQQLTKAELLAIANGESLPVELTRLWEPEPRLMYRGPAPFYVQSQERTVILKPKAPDLDWAEYGPADIDDDGTAVVEDYCMRVFRAGDA